jgi:hypothetical protein
MCQSEDWDMDEGPILKHTRNILGLIAIVTVGPIIAWTVVLYKGWPPWIAIAATMLLFVSPGGMHGLMFIFRPWYRRQHYLYRRGGPVPATKEAFQWAAMTTEQRQEIRRRLRIGSKTEKLGLIGRIMARYLMN